MNSIPQIIQQTTKAIICDLDNCLWDATMLDKYLPTDTSSREQWRLFELHYNEVITNQWCVNLVNAYRNMGYCILLVTSREDVDNCKGATLNSIYKALSGDLNNVSLFMRRQSDYRPSWEVKEEIYLNEIKDKFDVELAIDDDAKNCATFRKLGIPTMRVIIDN